MSAYFVSFFLLLVTVDNLWAGATVLRRQFIRETGIANGGKLLTLRGNTPFPNRFVTHDDYHRYGWLVQVERGVIFWSMGIYLRPSLQSAFEHQQRIPAPLNQGVYFINAGIAEDADSAKLDFWSVLSSPSTRIALYEGGEWHDGQVTAEMDVSRWRYLTVAEFSDYLPNSDNLASFPISSAPAIKSRGGVASYVVPSFALPKIVGINHAQRLGEKKFRSIFNKADRRFADGYRLLFNADNIEKIIKALQDQKRQGQQVTMNRYRNEEVANKLRNAFAGNKAFTISMVDPRDELVAGVVGYVHGNRFSPDSVFGDDVNDAKIADFSLMRYLTAHGINFVDAGMVTNYTADIGGYRVTREEFEQLVAELPENPIVLPTGWQGTISLVVASAKTSVGYLQELVDRQQIVGPLLLLRPTDNVRSPQMARADQRVRLLQELLARVEGVTIIESEREVRLFEGLPDSLVPYLREILAIDVDVVGKASIMKVRTKSGFPIPLLKEGQ